MPGAYRPPTPPPSLHPRGGTPNFASVTDSPANEALSKVATWLASTRRTAFEFQRAAWQAYLNHESGLSNAPTGTGKTLAAWLGPVVEALASQHVAGNHSRQPNDRHAERAHRGAAGAAGTESQTLRAAGPRVLWITPLRALANDLVGNLREPLEALGVPWTVEVRTGDTPASARKRQREKPPDALIITPESASLLLSYANSRDQLKNLTCVVVDEWHELLGTKRGVLLELTLAHLRSLNPNLRTWGLSATLPNLDEALHVLMGNSTKGRNLTLLHI